ncbi:hypothetical protein SLS64_009702 [Diaporthe eres]
MWPPDLYPPANIGWSIGILEDLSALADQIQAQTSPPQHQTKAADNPSVGAHVAQLLINAVDKRIRGKTRKTRKGVTSVTHIPKRPYLTCKDVKDVLRNCRAKAKGKGTANAYEDDEDKNMGEEEEEEEEQIRVEVELDDEGNESPEDCGNVSQKIDLSGNENGGHGSMDQVICIPSSPSSASTDAIMPQNNIENEHVAMVNSAYEESLPVLLNTMSTATAGANAVANVTATVDPRTISGVSIYNTQQSQSSSSRALLPDLIPKPMPGRLTPPATFRSERSPGHTPPAASSQPSFFPDNRPRLSSHSSGHLLSADQPGISDAQPNITNIENGTANMDVVDMSSESDSSTQSLALENREVFMDTEEMCTATEITRQYVRFDKSAAELRAAILRQRALNAEYTKTIAQEREICSIALPRIGSRQRKITVAKDTIERRASVQESLEHALDCLIKEDATDPNADDLKKVVSAYKDSINRIKAEVTDMEDDLAATHNKLRCSEKGELAAARRLDQGIKMLETTVTQYNTAISKKGHWHRMATYVYMRPERSSKIMNSNSIMARGLREILVNLTNDQQEAAL